MNRTRLEDVTAATGSSKSQLYHHFPDKEALVAAVISRRAEVILEREAALLGRLDSMRGLERWRDAAVNRVQLRRGAFGCGLGSLHSELADQDDNALLSLSRPFNSWQTLMVGALDRMQGNGVLRSDVDTDKHGSGAHQLLHNTGRLRPPRDYSSRHL